MCQRTNRRIAITINQLVEEIIRDYQLDGFADKSHEEETKLDTLIFRRKRTYCGKQRRILATLILCQLSVENPDLEY